MVTDQSYNYTSPAGSEFILAAGRFAGINPASAVLDLGSAFGEGACTLASQFRCKITAVESNKEKNTEAYALAVKNSVSHLISFQKPEFLDSHFHTTLFELALIEGGFLKKSSEEELIVKISALLNPRGWLCFSVPVALTESIPDEILAVFQENGTPPDKEDDFRYLAEKAGFDVHFAALAPQSGWDNYYAYLARHLEDSDGYYADPAIKIDSYHKIDAFYRLEAFRYIGYLFCIARKKV